MSVYVYMFFFMNTVLPFYAFLKTVQIVSKQRPKSIQISSKITSK